MVTVIFAAVAAASALERSEVSVVSEARAPSSRVTDLTGTLSGETVNRAETEIAGLEAARGSRIAVLIVSTTLPADIDDYGARVQAAWRASRGVGGDNALLLIAKDDRRIRIRADKGLATVLSPSVASRIQNEVIVPHFELGDFDGGIEAGVHQMIGVVNGLELPDPDRGWMPHRGVRVLLTLLSGVLIGAALALSWVAWRGFKSRRRGRREHSMTLGSSADLGGASGRW